MNGWKVTAIVFIILFSLLLIFDIWAISYALKDVERENECSINICVEDDAYMYYDFTGLCECYIDNELTKQEYIK